MRGSIVKVLVVVGALVASSAGPAAAYTWAGSSSPMVAMSGSSSEAAGYGTWSVSGSGRVDFSPLIETFHTKYNGAYANAFHTVSSNNVSWMTGPAAGTPRWNHTWYQRFSTSVQLPTAGGFSYVKTTVQIGQDRRGHVDPTTERSIPTHRY